MKKKSFLCICVCFRSQYKAKETYCKAKNALPEEAVSKNIHVGEAAHLQRKERVANIVFEAML